jgi:hypothetical protein
MYVCPTKREVHQQHGSRNDYALLGNGRCKRCEPLCQAQAAGLMPADRLLRAVGAEGEARRTVSGIAPEASL